MKEEDGLLNDLVRARLTSEEYKGLTKEKIDRFYIEEYGELPPNFEVITTEKLGVGIDSGFDGTAIHFHDEKINEVYLINRGTEPNIDQLKGLTDGLFRNVYDYKKNPDKLREIAFKGNEDIYTDVFGVLLGDDQSQTEDNIDFTDQVIHEVTEEKNNIKFYLDGHSLGGSEAQNLLTVNNELFTNTNVYNDAPMNIYNIIMVNDDLKDSIKENFRIDVKKSSDLKEIDTQELKSMLDKELGHLSDKITYYRNEDDLLTNLTLPFQYRLDNDTNVTTFESSNPDFEAVDLGTEYPLVMDALVDILGKATTDGLTFSEAAYYAAVYFKSAKFPEFMLDDTEKQLIGLQRDFLEMSETGHIGKGHSMDLLIKNLAQAEGRSIINNELIMTVSGGKGGKTIQLNIDATYQFYVYGHTILEGKQNALRMLEERIDTHITAAYKQHTSNVRNKMRDIETNPRAFLSISDQAYTDIGSYTLYSNYRFISNLPTQIPQVIQAQADEMLQNLQEESERQELLLEKYKKGIKDLTEADERVALLFDTYLERR